MPVVEIWWQLDVEPAGLCGGGPFGFDLLGVEAGFGFGDQPFELGGADLVGDHGDVLVDELCCCG